MRDRIIKHLGYKCLGPTITIGKIKRFQKALKDESFSDWQELSKVLSSSTRLKILWLLTQEKELCVCDLADILKISVSAISHQLKSLRQLKLVKTKKDAQTIYYSLNTVPAAVPAGRQGWQEGRANIYNILRGIRKL